MLVRNYYMFRESVSYAIAAETEFLTKDGVNANMLLVYSGLYDLNTRSLIYSYDKKLMENKYKYMQNNNLVPK